MSTGVVSADTNGIPGNRSCPPSVLSVKILDGTEGDMARTQKDVVSYFPHDANGGDTITVLQSRYGNDGYAFWFKLLEKLASADGHFLDCRNPIKWQLLLAKTGVNEITGVEIMNLLVEMQAIDKDLWESKLIWCQKLVDNIAEVYKNRRREIPLKPMLISLGA